MESNQHLKMVAKAIDFIETQLREPLSVQEVCALSPISPWQFQRVFRAVVGDSIGNYIRGRRLALAANSLQKSPVPSRILDIAVEFQFGSQEAFTRAFKDSFGMTPAELRKNPNIRVPTAKPKLDSGKILQIKNGIKKEPRIERLEEKYFVGLTMQIMSPLGVDTEFDGKAPILWEKFDQRRKEIAAKIPGVSYGFALSSNQNMEDDTLTYLAAAEVPHVPTEIPADMQVFHLPAQDYAVFEVIGFHESCHVTTDYIYGIWLPQSEFVRGPGTDFEFFAHKEYRRGDPKSVSFYYLPIMRK